jgi:hypothetical protein
MTTLYFIAMVLPFCVTSLFEPGNIGSASGTSIVVPILPPINISLQSDFSNLNQAEAWVFW